MLRLLENNSPDVILMNGDMSSSPSIPKDIPVILIQESFEPATLISSVESHFTGI